ncbi:hypothetical protein NL676_025235 [Syzygium grande]|nr:hypothetical protein NL676_025235 [Syzygium grande]
MSKLQRLAKKKRHSSSPSSPHVGADRRLDNTLLSARSVPPKYATYLVSRLPSKKRAWKTLKGSTKSSATNQEVISHNIPMWPHALFWTICIRHGLSLPHRQLSRSEDVDVTC